MITSGDEVLDGLKLTIEVNEIDDEFWASTDLQVPDREEVDIKQFYVLVEGLNIAIEKIKELITNLSDDQ